MKNFLPLFALLIAACASKPMAVSTPPRQEAPTATPVVLPNLALEATETPTNEVIAPVTPNCGRALAEGEVYTGLVVVELTLNEHYAPVFHGQTGEHIFFSGALNAEKLGSVSQDMKIVLYAVDQTCALSYMTSGNLTATWLALVEKVYGEAVPVASFTK